MHQFKDLNIWKKAMELTKEVYKISKLLPPSEQYGLTSQLNRCAISIPSNIAEGAGRNSPKEFLRFLSIANGSACELETQLLLLIELQLIDKDILIKHFELLEEIQKMNFSLQSHLKTKIKQQP